MNKTAGPAERRQAAPDRRSGGRRPFVAAVRHEAPEGPPHLGQAADLGLAGMRVRRRAHSAAPALPPRARVQVAFSLPDGGGLIRLPAEVVFDRPEAGACHLTGLRFADLPPEAAARLSSYLRSNA